MQTKDLLIATAANDADGRHIRKVAGWVHVFDALMSAAQLVPTENRNHACNGEPKALIALGATSEERCGDGDCQGEGTDSSTNEQQQREEIRFVAHGVLLLGSFEFWSLALLAALHASQRSKDAISDARGQRVGPLADGLGRDTYCIGGCCDRSTKQFYGASFKHDGR